MPGPAEFEEPVEGSVCLRALDAVAQPLRFEKANDRGGGFNFCSRIGGDLLLLSASEIVLRSGRKNVRPFLNKQTGEQASQLRMELLGANRAAGIIGLEQLPGTTNYLTGAEGTQWRAGVKSFARLRCEQIYPGIDIEYYGNQSELEYDFVLSAGSDPRLIALSFDGVETMAIEQSGDLLMRTQWGDYRQHRPVAFQREGNAKHEVAAAFRREGEKTVSFEIGQYDPALPLVIDPVLSYSTYLGGASADESHGVAVDSSGCVYVVGSTISSNFPALNAEQSEFSGPGSIEDAFVTKMNQEGNALIYSTYLGGHGSDLGLAIAVDSSGCVYVTGQTSSTDFPTTAGALQPSPGSGVNVFVAKLNPTGSELIYSTYLGGGLGNQKGNAIAVDSIGNAYLTGRTTAPDFPTTPSALIRELRGFEDAFVTKLDPTGSSLVYSTLLGGDSNTDEGFGVAVDSAGFAHVVGHTASTNFPTTAGAVQRQFGGGNEFGGDAFVTKINQSGSALEYSTYLGGLEADVGRAIAVSPEGDACVTGTTRSTNFQTANAIQPANASACVDNFSNCTDAFVARLSQSGDQLVYSTYLGGASRGSTPFQAGDSGEGIAVDQTGNAYVVGLTSSTDFPTMKAIQSHNAGNGDAYVAKLSVSGSLVYSTYIGGTGDEGATAVAVSANGAAYVVGVATSTGFPTTLGSFQVGFNGSFGSFALARDGFVVRITSDMPRIASAAISGKNLVVSGEAFDGDAVILLNGDPQRTKHDAPDPTIELKGKKTGKRIDPGQRVTLRVRNGDGVLSARFFFTRPVQ